VKRFVLRMAAVALLWGASVQVKAGIIYTNLGPGGTFDAFPNGWHLGGGGVVGSSSVVATQFTVPAGTNYRFTNAIAALGLFSGTDEVLMSLERGISPQCPFRAKRRHAWARAIAANHRPGAPFPEKP
jgi:hypothetical protein